MRVLQTFVLLAILTIVSAAEEQKAPRNVICNEKEISVKSNEEVEQLVKRFEKRPLCNIVQGHLVISNLYNIRYPIHLLSRIHHVVNGSIALINNTNVFPTIHLPNIRGVLGGNTLPTVMVLNNTKMHFSVGDHFWRVRTGFNITYAVLGNRDPIIDTNVYNLLHVAAYPRARFLMDSHVSVEPCQDSVYKPLAAVTGFMFVTLAVAFSTVAFYDRHNFE